MRNDVVSGYGVPTPITSRKLLPFRICVSSETTPATHKRTPVSAVTETTPSPRNSEGSNRGNRNTEDREDRNGNKYRDNVRQTGFAKDRFVKSKESEGKRNLNSTKGDFKVGEVSNVRVRLMKRLLKTREKK